MFNCTNSLPFWYTMSARDDCEPASGTGECDSLRLRVRNLAEKVKNQARWNLS